MVTSSMSKGPTSKRLPDFGRARFARAFGGDERGGERRSVHRHLELRPQIEQCAKMILMGMGEHDAGEVFALLHQIADVGQQ